MTRKALYWAFVSGVLLISACMVIAHPQTITNSPIRGSNGTNGSNGANAVNSGIRVQTDATGLYVWTFPAACLNAGNIPYFNGIPEGPTPQAGVAVNVQVEGVPTATVVSFRVTRVTATTVALLGLTILSVNTPAATFLDLTCAPK